MKISEDPEKSTVPGRKAVYRLLDAEGEDPRLPSALFSSVATHLLNLFLPSYFSYGRFF